MNPPSPYQVPQSESIQSTDLATHAKKKFKKLQAVRNYGNISSAKQSMMKFGTHGAALQQQLEHSKRTLNDIVFTNSNQMRLTTEGCSEASSKAIIPLNRQQQKFLQLICEWVVDA